MKKYLLSAICLMALVFVGCEPNAPSTSNKVVTGAASDVTYNSAVLHGEVNVDISAYNNVEFGMMISDVKDDLNNRDGEKYEAKVLIGKEFKLELSNLSPETEYYYCAWVFLNNTQYEFGDIKKFTTAKVNTGNTDNPNSKYKAKPFSVSASKQVYFSPGNLQYHPANNEWRFADNQADYVGSANSKISATYNGWIDLFGWGTGDNPTKSSTDYSHYQTFVDWGTNQIGNDAPNTWRTLSKDEWMYIFYNRPNAQSLFALGSVNGVNGTIILPDNWTTPARVSFVASTTKGLYWDGSYYYNSNGNNFSHNTYTSEQWSKMEQAGAVFLPASGCRWGSAVNYVGYNGNYWSSTEYNEDDACYVVLSSKNLDPQANYYRSYGFSVRLAQDL